MKINLTNPFKRFFRHGKREASPSRFWSFSLLTLLVCLFVLFLVHSFIFKTLRERIEREIDDFGGTSLLLDQNKIDKTYEFIEKRDSDLKNILNNKTDSIDPAI